MKLDDFYGNNYPDEDEMIWNFIGESDYEDTDFAVTFVPVQKYVTQSFIENFNTNATPEQKSLVDEYREDPSLKDTIVIVAGDILVDGHHRMMALYLQGIPKVKAIDLYGED